MTNPDFSRLYVVTVNWEKPGDTIECVRSVLQGGFPVEQVLVIDNGSHDDSIALIKAAFPQLTLVTLGANQGFAGGYNTGIIKALDAGAENVFILNNDTIIDQKTIPLLMKADWDICVPKIFFYHDPERIWAAGAAWRRFPPMVVMRGYSKYDRSRYQTPVVLEYATACALLIRRDVLEKTGGFDPLFENYHEDYDFAYRARQAGFQIGFVPDAHVWHKVSRSLGPASPRRWWYLGRNSVLFYRKDGRFSNLELGSFLAWFTVRECLKLNGRYLLSFWAGVRAGMRMVSHGNREM
jgi:GT2 family glycosyltransferase